LYMIGMGKSIVVEPQFTFGEEPVLVLIDDPGQVMHWPPAWKYLTDDLSQSLVRNEAATRVAVDENASSTHASSDVGETDASASRPLSCGIS